MAGGGVHLAAWSPKASAVLVATPSSLFRIWRPDEMWSYDNWHVASKSRVQTVCWSPSGSHLLFATEDEPIIYSLRVDGGGGTASAAVPLAEVSEVVYDSADGEEVP
jgi:WD40 repeat protein